MKKTILKGAAMLLGGVLLGTLLMIAVYAIPSETVWENVRVSVQTLANEKGCDTRRSTAITPAGWMISRTRS